MKKILIFFLSFVLLSGCSGENTSETKTISNENLTLPSYSQKSEFPNDSDEIVVLKTNYGDVYLWFFPEAAPKAVENFITHSKNGYYNGILFHRVIKNFMIQGGDPQGTGRGGESIWGKDFENEFIPEVSNKRGSIAMANSGPNTNGSQFFINTVNNSFLDGYQNGKKKRCVRGVSCHTIFGEVFYGLEIVDSISQVRTGANDKPLKDVIITQAEVKTFGEVKNILE